MSNVRLDIDGPIAMITNDRPDKHNAFDDDMDLALFEILGELRSRPDIRAVIWRGTGKSFSSGRDIQQLFDLDAPVIVACYGWTLGGSFQRALLCDIRIAATGARFMLPEVGHGVIPDTGGVARLFQICGPGLVSDLVLTGRVLEAEEALAHGIVSRVVTPEALDDTAREMAERIAAAPAATVKLARRVIGRMSEPQVRASMEDELIGQTYVNRSDDFAEFRAARAEGRQPRYTGS